MATGRGVGMGRAGFALSSSALNVEVTRSGVKKPRSLNEHPIVWASNGERVGKCYGPNDNCRYQANFNATEPNAAESLNA